MARTTTKKDIDIVTEITEDVEKPKTAPKRKKAEITADTIIEVMSNFAGTLVYVSKKTADEYTWQLGEVNYIKYSELEIMRNNRRKFFTNNWVILLGDEGLEAMKKLGVDKYYTNLIDVSDTDALLSMSDSELTAKIKSASNEIKETLGYCLSTLIDDGKLSDLNRIRLFEKLLNVDLIQR